MPQFINVSSMPQFINFLSSDELYLHGHVYSVLFFVICPDFPVDTHSFTTVLVICSDSRHTLTHISSMPQQINQSPFKQFINGGPNVMGISERGFFLTKKIFWP
jgi:hypothetical protein